MTRTDVMASSRPQTTVATSAGSGSAHLKRRLLAAPALALGVLALLIPGAALAAEGTSGYNQTPTTPTTPATTPTTPATTPTTPATTPATTPTPTTGTSPSKEEGTPAAKEEPAKATSTPTTKSEKASTLPFTGFDLRWTLAVGLLLMGAGFSIIVVQRRERRGGSR
jgi:hypothetical protein